MGFLAQNFKVEQFDLTASEAYSKITHVEIDLPTGYCRVDLAWFTSKDASVENKKSLDTWSFVLNLEEINNLLRNEGNETVLALAYNTIRNKDERFETIQDDK